LTLSDWVACGDSPADFVSLLSVHLTGSAASRSDADAAAAAVGRCFIVSRCFLVGRCFLISRWFLVISRCPADVNTSQSDADTAAAAVIRCFLVSRCFIVSRFLISRWFLINRWFLNVCRCTADVHTSLLTAVPFTAAD